MIFGDNVETVEGLDWRNPKKVHRERSLASALGNVIWRAGDGQTGELSNLHAARTEQEQAVIIYYI